MLLIGFIVMLGWLAFVPQKWGNPVAISLSVIAAIIILQTAVERFTNESSAALETLFAAQAQPTDTALFNDYTGWLTVNAPSRPEVYSIPPDITAEDPQAQTIFRKVQREYQRIWFATRQPTANWIESAFWRDYFVGDSQIIGDYRVILFDLHESTDDDIEQITNFESLNLMSYSIEQTQDAIYMTLNWSGQYPPNSQMFLHLLDADGQIIQQHDRLPLNGLIEPRENVIRDRHVFPLMAREQPAALRLGWVRPDGTFIPADQDDYLLLPISD